MNYPGLVRGIETGDDLPCDDERRAKHQRSRAKPLSQILPLQKLHHEIGGVVFNVEIVNVDQVRVVEPAGDLRLTL